MLRIILLRIILLYGLCVLLCLSRLLRLLRLGVKSDCSALLCCSAYSCQSWLWYAIGKVSAVTWCVGCGFCWFGLGIAVGCLLAGLGDGGMRVCLVTLVWARC